MTRKLAGSQGKGARWPAWRRSFVLPVVLAACLGLGPDVLGASGERAEMIGNNQAEASLCSQLRSAGTGKGDAYQVCLVDRSNGEVAGEPCLSFPLTPLVRGDTRSFCEDSYRNKEVRSLPLAATPLYERTTIEGSSYGAITRLLRGGTPSDRVSVSFSGTGTGSRATAGQTAFAEVVECTGPSCPRPNQCGKLQIRYNQTACTNVRQNIDRTVAPNESLELKYFLLFQTLSVIGGDGSWTMFVCPGYTAQCTDEAGASGTGGIIPIAVESAPNCLRTRSGWDCSR